MQDETFVTAVRNPVARGIMLKCVGWNDVWAEAGAIVAFTVVVGAVAMLRDRQTID